MVTASCKLVKNGTFRASVLPDGRWILFEPTTNRVAVLTSSAGVFWELCSGEAALSSVIAELAALYPDRPPEGIAADAYEVAQAMIDGDLVALREA
jgi:hypothetical protein